MMMVADLFWKIQTIFDGRRTGCSRSAFMPRIFVQKDLNHSRKAIMFGSMIERADEAILCKISREK